MRLKDRQPGAPLGRILFYEFARAVARLTLRMLFGARATGIENIPKTGALLLVANHQSFLDPPTIAVLVPHRHLEFVARASLFKSFFGHLISMLNSIPIQDETGDSAAIREVLRRLEMQRAVLIFPEGSRTEDGEIHEFKRGAALIVKRSKCPVLPVAITGAYERWPATGKPRFSGPPVRVKYGTTISHDELMKDGADAAMQRLQAEVVKLKAELDHGGTNAWAAAMKAG
jgi:1-acyl-sn-glycerol-3-phosphate acyltransferase